MQSDAKTVKEDLKSLPEDRSDAISKVREVILKNLPKGYEETMNWGMISYEVPLEVYPETYNKKPLMYAALASQKNYMSLYLIGIYISEKSQKKFESEYKATGKRYNVGKSCVRFKRIDDLPIQLIGKTIASLKIDDFIARVKEAHSAINKK